MKYFKEGMKVSDVRFGTGIVQKDTKHFITVDFKGRFVNYDYEGRMNKNENVSLFQREPIIEVNVPILEFEQGELVIVRNVNEFWNLRYFSHFENGHNWCFFNQKTEGQAQFWDETRKLTDNLL